MTKEYKLNELINGKKQQSKKRIKLLRVIDSSIPELDEPNISFESYHNYMIVEETDNNRGVVICWYGEFTLKNAVSYIFEYEEGE